MLAKWLSESNDLADSDTEVTLASARSNDSDSLSIAYSKKNEGVKGVKLNKSRRNTIDEFLSKLERDHLDMELSYGKLFQELGYTFLTNANQEPTDEDDDEYKEFNERISDSVGEMTMNVKQPDVKESQMDKIKYTLDDLRVRINEMRRKFRQYNIKSKRTKVASQQRQQQVELSETDENEDEDVEADEDEEEDVFKLCVYVKQQGKIVTFKIHRKCKVGELKQILFEKLADPKENSIDELILTYNNLELLNDAYSIKDYGVSDKSTITLEFL